MNPGNWIQQETLFTFKLMDLLKIVKSQSKKPLGQTPWLNAAMPLLYEQETTHADLLPSPLIGNLKMVYYLLTQQKNPWIEGGHLCLLLSLSHFVLLFLDKTKNCNFCHINNSLLRLQCNTLGLKDMNQIKILPDNLLSMKSLTFCTGTTKFPPPIIAALCSNSLWENTNAFFKEKSLYDFVNEKVIERMNVDDGKKYLKVNTCKRSMKTKIIKILWWNSDSKCSISPFRCSSRKWHAIYTKFWCVYARYNHL